MACAPSEESDQPGHPPSLIRVFAVRMKKAWVLSYLLSAQRRVWVFAGRTVTLLFLPWGSSFASLSCLIATPHLYTISCAMYSLSQLPVTIRRLVSNFVFLLPFTQFSVLFAFLIRHMSSLREQLFLIRLHEVGLFCFRVNCKTDRQ